MSTSVLPIAATGSSAGDEPAASAAAAAERVQQLRALIAQVETGASQVGVSGSNGSGSAGASFASALDSAQSGASAPTASALDSAQSGAGEAIASAPYPAQSGADESIASALDSAQPGAAAAAATAGAYTPLIEQAAARYGLDPAILQGLIQQESGFDPSARSGAGALGLTQLMPSTAASLGVAEPLDPAQSIEGGALYLSQLLHRFDGSIPDALAAYNAGPGAVQQYGGVPPYAETQQYVAKVLGYAASYRDGGLA